MYLFVSLWVGEKLAIDFKISDVGGQLDSGCYISEESAGEAMCQGGESGGVIGNS